MKRFIVNLQWLGWQHLLSSEALGRQRIIVFYLNVYRHLSADSKMKYYKINSSFNRPDVSGIDFVIFFNYMIPYVWYDTWTNGLEPIFSGH